MAEKSFDLHQKIFQQRHSAIRVDVYHEDHLHKQILHDFLGTVSDNGIIGVAPAYGSKSILVLIALSSPTNVLIVRLSKSRIHGKTKGSGRQLLRDFVFLNPDKVKCAFRMDRLSAGLFLDINCWIVQGIDLVSRDRTDGRESLEALMKALGEEKLNKAALAALFEEEESAKNAHDVTALQAWSACQGGSLWQTEKTFATAPRINTQEFNPEHLAILVKTIRDSQRLMAMKPSTVKNEVDPKFTYEKGQLGLTCTRFKTRIMRPENRQVILIESIRDGKRVFTPARTTQVVGRSATLSMKGSLSGGTIKAVRTVGRDALTVAEASREDVILTALQGTNNIMKHPFVKLLWLPFEKPSWNARHRPRPGIPVVFPLLNASQKTAVDAILSNNASRRVVLIHGPPGTGKTTVIAATASSVLASGQRERTLWLVAQSNVAVKNIAEKLAKVKGLSFKILVSKDFHFDWHEHLYEKISSSLIRSDKFTDDIVETAGQLGDSRIILCTLSMLSNPRLDHYTRHVKLETIIFDEASQINIGDYFPLLNRFHTTLRKLVFVGDDKQLAPYGQSDIEELESIFEMSHLRPSAVFLDTQYRMPIPIGNFISANVYENRLKSVHKVTTSTSCQFVDVSNGKEERKGLSWINHQECKVVVRLAKALQAAGKSYRVITPYDAQRSLLENAFKSSKLPWQDKCFNVDSFQGNEDDHIIISVVRSKQIGFLREKRRTNVMLTRCKKGMIICTNRTFVEAKAQDTLVGALARSLGEDTWVPSKLVLDGKFAPFKY